MKYKVKIRRGKTWIVRPEAEQIDNKVYNFEASWVMDEEDSSIYVGETVMLPRDDSYPKSAPAWVASGDLVEV